MKKLIIAQALSIRDAKSRLVSHTDEIEEHMIKLLLSPDSQTRNHWIGEIASQINSVKRMSKDNKYPSADMIFKWLYTEQLAEIDDFERFQIMMEDISDYENLPMPDFLEELHEKYKDALEAYYRWLSKNLSALGYVKRSDAMAVLNELL